MPLNSYCNNQISLVKLSIVLGLVILLSLQFYLTGYSCYGIIKPPAAQEILRIAYQISYFSSLLFVGVFIIAWLKTEEKTKEEITGN